MVPLIILTAPLWILLAVGGGRYYHFTYHRDEAILQTSDGCLAIIIGFSFTLLLSVRQPTLIEPRGNDSDSENQTKVENKNHRLAKVNASVSSTYTIKNTTSFRLLRLE